MIKWCHLLPFEALFLEALAKCASWHGTLRSHFVTNPMRKERCWSAPPMLIPGLNVALCQRAIWVTYVTYAYVRHMGPEAEWQSLGQDSE